MFEQPWCELILTAHSFKEVESLGLHTTMNEKHSQWGVLQRSYFGLLYYESVFEHDYDQLRKTRKFPPPIDDTQETFIPDRNIKKCKKEMKVRLDAEYLNQLAAKSVLSARSNKGQIYERTLSVSAKQCRKIDEFLQEDSTIILIHNFMQTMFNLKNWKIDPRKRWRKLYYRNHSFEIILKSLSDEIHKKVIHIRNVSTAKEPRKLRYAVSHFRKQGRVSRSLIYRRCRLRLLNEERCFPLIWKESCSSNVFDEVSGQALCHITLLCRDVICECNICKTGCPSWNFPCDACNREELTDITHLPKNEPSGSFPEECTLPTFYVQTDDSEVAVLIQSDIDFMIDRGMKVGFDGKNDNIMVIETENSPPGHLQLRDIGTGKLVSMLHNGPDSDVFYFTRNGPASTWTSKNTDLRISYDKVGYFSCSSWPPVALRWIDRKRYCNWPSIVTIQTIVSKGCRIVHKSHELSKNKVTEFRFSFSEAELILFKTLTRDQRKCFIAFKAVMKHIIYKLVNKTRDEIKLNSYCLKTIFLWACETIPANYWQATNGWSMCLLYLIDQLLSCLERGNLPGYFIPESNLLDAMKWSRPFFDEIEKLRCNPTLYAAAFIDSTTCFKDVCEVTDEINILCHDHEAKGTILMEQLLFLHNIVTKIDGIRSCQYWRKEAVLRIFANWCTENANDIGFAPWECLSGDMTLFDVVYLDIVHGFDVPYNVLMEYVDNGWSGDLISRLGFCYSFDKFDQKNPKNESKYPFHFKTFLMLQHALDYEYASIETILTCVALLINHEEFAIAARVLESGAGEVLTSDVSILIDYVFASIISSETINDLCELTNIAGLECDAKLFRMSVPIFTGYASYVCYKNLGYREKLNAVLIQMKFHLLDFISNDNRKYRYRHTIMFSSYLENLLFHEIYETVREMRSLLFGHFMSMKTYIIKLLRAASHHKHMIYKENENNFYTLGLRKTIKDSAMLDDRLFCSCNKKIGMILPILVSSSNDPENKDNYDHMTDILTRHARSAADRMYLALFLIFVKRYDRAASVLNAIIDEEGDFSMSVVVCPKAFWEWNFLDDNLCRELKIFSADHFVLPTSLFARYLLVNVHNSLGQIEQCDRNKIEFNILRQRYSTILEFAAILNVLSKIL